MKQATDVTADETIEFKKHLLSLGVSDPVTKSAFGSGQQFYQQLARELHTVLAEPLDVSRRYKYRP